MENLVSPYRNNKLHTRVMLPPRQMDNNLYINLKINLRKKVERKCNKYGYVSKVHKILEYKNGIIKPENFSAAAVFDVVYSGRICIPIENTQIICQIEKMHKVLIMAKNGPVAAIIKINHINDANFNYTHDRDLVHIKTGKKIKIGDFVKLTVKAKKFNAGDVKIGIMGFLDDIATKSEINKYFYEEQTEVTDTETETEIVQEVQEYDDIETEESVSAGSEEEHNYIEI